MDQNNKIYMNQIWHKVNAQENEIKLKKEKTKKQKFMTLSYSFFMLILALCLIYKPELLEGISTIIGLIIISLVTFSEYKKLKGASYDF